MKQIFVTKKGLQALETRRLECMDKLRFVQSQKSEAAEVGGNVWHDNFAFEDLVRQENMVNKQIRDMRELLEAAVVVPDMPLDVSTLQVGHVAHLYIEDDDVTKEVAVGGFGESDLNANPPIIDYSAPLLEPFYGQEEGHEVVIKLGGVSKNVVLETIELRGY
jgi:transcription elongation GreA/GreB family factor